jgi:hypothetical protein
MLTSVSACLNTLRTSNGTRAALRDGTAGQLPGALKYHWNKSEIRRQFIQGLKIINLPGAPISPSGPQRSFQCCNDGDCEVLSPWPADVLFCATRTNFCDSVSVLTKHVRFIWPRSPYHGQSQNLLRDLRARCCDVICHSEVRWLHSIKMRKGIFAFRKEAQDSM